MGNLDKIGEQEEMMLKTIRINFPDISWELYEIFDNGRDNQVIMLDKKLIFRFPRNEYVKNIHQKEKELLWHIISIRFHIRFIDLKGNSIYNK